jgi:hypothetical protein
MSGLKSSHVLQLRPATPDKLRFHFGVAPPDSDFKEEPYPGYMAPMIRLPRADARCQVTGRAHRHASGMPTSARSFASFRSVPCMNPRMSQGKPCDGKS